ncbi:signal peptide containing protein [Theileria equi strain WA]|uniref:Signal peptide containing protein n=1 Tax=Theileria equi strain WA TaxID=1537102 RepID=L1L9W5_THEEQ|nr:signal peptide containing protein [Theileria equi strain WA]EKX72222.1 signal peptide containing protein [Theileria equi strain WA]|eukprot:XP_004831674.1 signal peptide containing protein [Theileria equi strain WA]
MFLRFGLWLLLCGLWEAPGGGALSLGGGKGLQTAGFIANFGTSGQYPSDGVPEWRMNGQKGPMEQREWRLHMIITSSINGVPKPRKLHKKPPWYKLFEEEVEKEPLGPPCKNLAKDVIEGKRRLRFTLKRSNKQMYATIVDDVTRQTHCFLSTNFKYLSHIFGSVPTNNPKITRNKGWNVKAAYELGKLIGRQALSRGISKVFFDRANYSKCCHKDYDHDDDDVYVKVAQGSSKELPTESPNVPSSPGVIDISNPDREQCQTFKYSFDGNVIRLVVPEKGLVRKLAESKSTIWTLSSGEAFDHAKVYLNKDSKPELVLVTLETPYRVSHKAYYKNGSRWESCNNHEGKMKSLKVPETLKSTFELDISSADATEKCKIFEANLLGVPTKHIFPKLCYVVVGVRDGNQELWTAQPHYSRVGIRGTLVENNDYCLSCLVYKKGSLELLEMTVVESKSRKWKYFEKTADGWKELTRNDFLNKFHEMKRESEAPLNPVDEGSRNDHTDVPPKDVVQQLEGSVSPSDTSMEGTTLDLSSPDSSLFSLADDLVYGVSHKAFVPQVGSSVVSVVENGDTLWTATDPQEGCTGAYLFSREGYSSLLSVYTRGAGDETFCFEKVDGAWKNVDKLEFESKLFSMKDFSTPAGEEHREEDT